MNADEIVRAQEALEIVFEHLDTSGWKDSYICAGNAGSRESNMYFKQTVADKKEFLYEMLSSAINEIESLQAQLAEITAKPELTSPVRYYTDGKPYVQIGGLELHDHPVAEACARLDRYEKYIIPHLQTKLAASQRREKEAVEALNLPIDYICAIKHYDKYDSRYTFALPSQWYSLEFSSFEDYQEFQMQLVYLLGEAKKKWDGRKRGPQEVGEGEKDGNT